MLCNTATFYSLGWMSHTLALLLGFQQVQVEDEPALFFTVKVKFVFSSSMSSVSVSCSKDMPACVFTSCPNNKRPFVTSHRNSLIHVILWNVLKRLTIEKWTVKKPRHSVNTAHCSSRLAANYSHIVNRSILFIYFVVARSHCLQLGHRLNRLGESQVCYECS